MTAQWKKKHCFSARAPDCARLIYYMYDNIYLIYNNNILMMKIWYFYTCSRRLNLRVYFIILFNPQFCKMTSIFVITRSCLITSIRFRTFKLATLMWFITMFYVGSKDRFIRQRMWNYIYILELFDKRIWKKPIYWYILHKRHL